MAKRTDDNLLVSKEKSNKKRNIFRYLLLFFLSLTYAYFYGGFFPYTLLYLVVSFPLLSLLHLVVVYMSLRISERMNERVFVKGECASYNLVIQNSSFLYVPYITVNMFMEGEVICKDLRCLRLSMAPFSTREYNYNLPLIFRGSYDIGVKSIFINDLLGFFTFSIKPYEKKSILVRPRIILNNYTVPAARISEGEIISGNNKSGNDEIVDIREYIHGDSFRKIHWKLSSKLGKTMVKETRNQLDNDVIIVLNLNSLGDLNEEKLSKEDCLIEEIVAKLNFLIKQNIPVKLCFYNKKPITYRATSPLDFNTIYQVLSEIKFNQKKDFSNVLEYFLDIEQNSNLFFIFSVDLNSDIITKAFQIKSKGFDLELYYLNMAINDEDNKISDDFYDVLLKNNIRPYKLEPVNIDLKNMSSVIEETGKKMEVNAYEA